MLLDKVYYISGEAMEEGEGITAVSPEVSDVVDDILDAVVAQSGQYYTFFAREHSDKTMDVQSVDEKEETLLLQKMVKLLVL